MKRGGGGPRACWLVWLTLVFLSVAGCGRSVAPALPHDPENVRHLREEMDQFDW